MANPNDQIRRKMLRWFYDRNDNATSTYGKKGSAVKTQDMQKGLKADYGLSRQEVMSNLTYLIDKGWINKREIAKSVSTRGGTVIPSTVVWYEISAAGIDRIEGESEFQENARYPGINVSNINATGNNVITLGNGNIVNARYGDLHQALTDFEHVISGSNIDESQKLDVCADIESIKDQLAKAMPDKTIIGHLWSRIQDVATVGGFVDALSNIGQMIAPLLPAAGSVL